MNAKHFFPILSHHPELIYLDSGATTLTPEVVIEAEKTYHEQFGTNALRGLYPQAEKTDLAIQDIRAKVASFVGADTDEVVFTFGTTHALNLLAQSFEPLLTSADSILVSSQEHHANFLPWKEVATQRESLFDIIPTASDGYISQTELKNLITPQTKIVALTMVSNVLGVKNDIPALVRIIRTQAPEACIILDAAQAVAHIPIDFHALGVDALVFSAHKMYGSTGVGALIITQKLQEKLTPGIVGGGMVLDATATPTLYKEGVEKFEAGTQNLSGIFGFGAAIDFIQTFGFEKIQKHDQTLATYAIKKLTETFGKNIIILGTQNPEERTGVISYTLSGVHPHDIASLLGNDNVCVRAGEHCARPLHQALAIPASTRISFGLYTTTEDIDACITSLQKAYALFLKK